MNCDLDRDQLQMRTRQHTHAQLTGAASCVRVMVHRAPRLLQMAATEAWIDSTTCCLKAWCLERTSTVKLTHFGMMLTCGGCHRVAAVKGGRDEGQVLVCCCAL